jgi:Predicted amino acid aldolase or racemase
MTTKNEHTISQLETPCLLLNRELMERNYTTLSERLKRYGVSLRPHVKTIKSTDVAKALFGDSEITITVSTLKEAEEFAKMGITDMVYAVGISPNKLQRIRKIRECGVDLKVILDSVQQAEIISNYVQQTGDRIGVLIEIDCDQHRAGIKPDDKASILKIAGTLRDGGAEVKGVLSHSGGSYYSKCIDEIIKIAEQERQAVVNAANILQQHDFDTPIISIGSTPAALFARDFTGITEVRAGVFIFFDLVMACLGVCKPEDIAISVLATVIGHQTEKGWIIVDAGWMAMSRDKGIAGQKVDMGYGLVCNENGEVIEDLIMVAANQEHGILAFRDGRRDICDAFPIGTMLRLLPNHICATAAQHQEYYVIEKNRVTNMWSRFNGW